MTQDGETVGWLVGWLVGSATHPDLSHVDPASRHIYAVQVRAPHLYEASSSRKEGLR